MKSYKVLGLMSGSSLDGLDLALCQFNLENQILLNWELLSFDTLPLPYHLKEGLSILYDSAFQDLTELESQFTNFTIETVAEFLSKYESIDLIGHHGHTVQHLPKQKISLQLGSNKQLQQVLKIPIVGNFRAEDLKAGGVGTPMAPLADRDLFKGYDFYINLGGIINISYAFDGEWQAFDIAPCNQVMNYFAKKEGREFDRDGDLAEEGKFSSELFNHLLRHPFVHKNHPKSLDNQEVLIEWIKPIEEMQLEVRTILYTYNEFLALLLQRIFIQANKQEIQVLLSGGGTHNRYLIERFQFHNPGAKFIKPPKEIIDFKEAILIAYAALLRSQGQPNFIASVTGASKNVIGGELFT